MSDRLRLQALRARCRVGVPAAERRRRQEIVFDVDLEVPLRRAGRGDDFRHSPDYHALERTLRRRAEERPYVLLEALAEAVAAAALAFDKRVRAVRVQARKRPAAMPRTGGVIVDIYRKR